jgi:hypothetical protein
MASQEQWNDKLRGALDARVDRSDVRLAFRVDADPGYPIDEFDDVEFAEWAADWVDFTVASTGGPLMPGTAETEWSSGSDAAVRVHLLLQKVG